MLLSLTRRLAFWFKTPEQTNFINSLPKFKFTSDEEMINNIR